MPPRLLSLSSPVASADAGTSAGGASDTSAICASLSCFFRWYPLITSPPSSLVAFAGAGASASGASSMFAVCASLNCFLDDTPRLHLLVVHWFV